ncbi:MAG: NAD(P)/FAD-dependent oxidoreductase [Clostridia bacterium]|nr:NAD(P)/FAD-dependent oxidoreductase [Clostridia bacterium]
MCLFYVKKGNDKMYDVAIIGAGVIGALTARELSRYNLKCVVLEKENDVAMGTSKANSAIVHAGFDAKEGSKKAYFNVKGSEMMEKVASELGVKYIRNGSLVLAFDDEDMKTVEELYERGVKNGVKGLFILNREELIKVEPNIGDDAVGALHATTGAIICPYGLAIAAMGNAMDNGCELKTNFNVKNIEKGEGKYIIASDNETVEASFVVNAAGLFADELNKNLEASHFSTHPRKGEYFVMDKAQGSLVKSTVFVTPSAKGKGILVSPTVDGNLLLGPTADDIEDKTDIETTDEGAAKIRSQAMRSVKGIDMRKVITSFAGLRAVGNTGDFEITAKDNYVAAMGIESPGLSASPAIAEHIAELLFGMGLKKEENKDFNPVRRPMDFFKALSKDEKNALIKERPSYGRIVCRCEEITEGEIIDALTLNPKAKDLDGVKRRTRSGMGRCQGGFCSPSVTELIAKISGVAYEDVTKTGEGSGINFERTKGGVKNA